MIIGNTFHTYSLNHAIQPVQPPVKPAEKPSTGDGNLSGQTQ
ncbi:hypothetical protein [Pseudomonas sp. O39]